MPGALPAAKRILVHFEIKRVRMYYRSGTGGTLLQSAGHTLRVHPPGGSTVLLEMASWPPS